MTTSNDPMVAALLRERATYKRQRKTDRVKQVDEQLQRLGYTGDEDQDDEQPKARTPQDPGQQSADTSGSEKAPTDAGAAAADGTAAPEQKPAAKTPAKKAAAARAKTAE